MYVLPRILRVKTINYLPFYTVLEIRASITTVVVFHFTTLRLVTLTFFLSFNFLTIDLYFFSPFLALLTGRPRIIGLSSALSSVTDSDRPSNSVDSIIFSISSRMMGWFNPTLITDWVPYLRIMLHVLSMKATRVQTLPVFLSSSLWYRSHSSSGNERIH